MWSNGTPYEWEEYLLFNPYKGFRYITQYQGHWNFVKTLQMLPEATSSGGRPAMKLLGGTYKHFQTAVAQTTYVMGEFPWQVRVGEQATVQDYIGPPRMLSSEVTGDEVTWSLSEYTEGTLIYQAFGIKGAPPQPKGVYANQPAPKSAKSNSAWGTWLILNIILFMMMLAFSVFSRNDLVLNQRYSFAPGLKTEASFVTEPFELKGRTSNVEVELRTDISNNSAYFNLALINEGTGQAYDFGREVSYYTGRDSDGSWSEGKSGDVVVIPSVPSGRYYLRVEPEVDLTDTSNPPPGNVSYSIQVRRDVPTNMFFWIAALLLLIPPVLKSFGGKGFEARRWQESDYAG